MIRGSYRGMSYRIQMIHHSGFGKHYDITLAIGAELSHQRESSLSRGVQRICQQANPLLPGAETVFGSANVDKLIHRWHHNNKLIQHEAAMTAPKAPLLIAEMIQISIELKNMGYSLGDDGCWFHLSSVN